MALNIGVWIEGTSREECRLCPSWAVGKTGGEFGGGEVGGELKDEVGGDVKT